MALMDSLTLACGRKLVREQYDEALLEQSIHRHTVELT
jgi:hypothetical protein